MTKQIGAKGMLPFWILAGELLLVLGFYFITQSTDQGPVAWLNLAVCMLVFLVDTSAPLLFARTVTEFSVKIPSIGILWLLRVLYTLASLSVILAGWHWAIAFRFQLLAQLTVLLVACGMVLASMYATEHAGIVTDEEGRLFANIELLRDGMASLAMQISRLPTLSGLTKRVNRCSEDVRYLTPSKNPRALELDSQLVQKIRETEALLVNQSLPGTSVDDLRTGVAKMLEDLAFLLQQRKSDGVE